METNLRPHQKRFIEWNPDRMILVWAPRSGKSLAGQMWTNHERRFARSYVICLKKNKREWMKRCPDSIVWTKEEFRKNWKEISDPTAIMVDEVHNFAAPLFVAKKRSLLATGLYNVLKKYPNCHFLGLSGTPLTNDPASVHTLLTYMGHYIEWPRFRDSFYSLEYRPFIPRPAYFPVSDWRLRANELIHKYMDVVALRDCVDILPPEVVEEVEILTPKKKYEEGEEYHWTKDHIVEQSLKAKAILELGYRKAIVVCHYTEQIATMEKELSREKPVYIIKGQVKDQEGIIAKANADPDGYLIVQASLGEGFDGYYYDALIFASMSHTVRHHTQMKARLDTVEKHLMKPKFYYYLIAKHEKGTTWDRRIYDSIMAGEDFNPMNYKYEPARTTEEIEQTGSESG